MYPLFGQLDELPGGRDAHRIEELAVAASDTPDLVQGKGRKYLFDVLGPMHVTAAVEFRVALGQLRGDLGQSLGRRDADAHGNARVAAYRAADATSVVV